LIEFQSIRFKNFLSYGNQWTEVSLNSSDTTLVKGTNGNGKSTFLDAIVYGLFGKGFRKSSNPDLVNNVNRKALLVEIQFKVKGKKYKIERGIKPSIFNIWVDGKQRHNDAKIKDQQYWLEQNVLGMNEKSFRQIIVLGTGNYTPFMRLAAGERRKVIEQLLDIEIFGFMNDVLKKKSISLRNEVSGVEHEIALLNTEIETAKKHIKASAAKSKITKEKAHKEVERLQGLIDELIHVNENLQYPIIDGMDKRRDKIRNIITLTENKIKKAEKKITLYQKNDECPTCSQGISEEFKIQQIDYHTSVKDQAESNLQQMDTMLEDITIDLNTHKEVCDKRDTNDSEISKYQSLIERIQQTVEDLDESQDEEFKDEFDKNNATVYKKQKILYNLSNRTRLFNVIELMLKDSGIKTRIIKKYLPVLNTIINKYLKEFEFNITLTLDELFTETVTKNGKELYGYSGFSEGEKLRMDLAILFAFRELAKIKNSVSTNLLILDEILDSSLDRTGIEHFLKIIREQENTKIYVISHKGDLGDHFKRTIKVSKKGQFSQTTETIL